jgi:hypothetical protein
METLNSITEISRVLNTSGSNPVVVMVEGFDEYVCKYSANTPAKKLLIEYLGFSFAQIWGIPIPDAAFVNISQDHIPDAKLASFLNRRSFEIPTFGSRYRAGSKEIDQTVISSWLSKPSQLKKIKNKEDLLKIGLFDIWLANEDRCHNNSNLMVASEPDGMKLIAIDHEKCFNSGVIDPAYTIYQINAYDSILNFDLVPLFYKQNSELERITEELLNEFPVFVANCQARLAPILQLIPAEWRIVISLSKVGLLKQKRVSLNLLQIVLPIYK